MQRRFINCSACRGCHTGRGGRYCQFVSPGGTRLLDPGQGPGLNMAAADVPDRGSPEYEEYLADRIAEEESRLRTLKDKCRVTAMEEQLASLRLQTTEMSSKNLLDRPVGLASDTGVAAQLLSAVNRGAAGGSKARSPLSDSPVRGFAVSPHRPREDKESLSKLQALSHLPEPKAIEKITYRDFICAMTKVLRSLTELDIDPSRYAAHMSFITTKAALNLYATDALIRYDAAVTSKVISGELSDWVAADPECVALHLGADATYAVRQGGTPRWGRQTSGNFGQSRDFSDWPKDICWLFNNTSCYFPRCKKAHICCKCKKTSHTMKECKASDDSLPGAQPEVLSTKSQKEGKKV